jgi:predicted transcriptional regulator
MKSKKHLEPTSAELEILNALWDAQPMTVREVHNTLKNKKQVGYTTILKIMQNMFAKGLVKRELQGKSHLYSATYKKEATRQNLLDKFLDTTFSGSASSLVMQLLGNKKTSKKELEDIKRAIEELEKNILK